MSESARNTRLGSFECFMPTKIVFGVDRVDSIGEEAKLLGRHAYVVAAQESMEKIGALQRVVKSLNHAGMDVVVFKEVRPDPEVSAIDAAAAACRAERCDVVVGLGGGSALDFAKGVAVGAAHEGSVLEYMMGRTGSGPKQVTARTLPVVAIPTTAGTGSEVTAVAVMTVPDTHEKHSIMSPRIVPRVALIDPGLTLSLPGRVTAATGFDVCGHAIEAYVSKFTTPFADMVALEALRLAGKSLVATVNTPRDVVARENMAWAATLGGLAIAHAGMTVAHGIASVLGGRLGLPHGEAVAFCLPEVMERIGPAREDRLANLADVMGFSRPNMSTEERAQACIEGLKALRRSVKLDMRLSEIGVPEWDLGDLATAVFETQLWSVEHHPQTLDERDVEAILRERA